MHWLLRSPVLQFGLFWLVLDCRWEVFLVSVAALAILRWWPRSWWPPEHVDGVEGHQRRLWDLVALHGGPIDPAVLATAGCPSAPLQGVLELNTVARTVRVAAHISVRKVSEELVARGWMLPVIPADPASWTVSQLLLGAGQGRGSHRYGLFKDAAVAYEVALPDGGVRRVSEASDAELFYALPYSQGSLGALLACELRIIPAAATVELRCVPGADLNQVVARLLRSAVVESRQPGFRNAENRDYLAPGEARAAPHRRRMHCGSGFQRFRRLEQQFDPRRVPHFVEALWIPHLQMGLVVEAWLHRGAGSTATHMATAGASLRRWLRASRLAIPKDVPPPAGGDRAWVERMSVRDWLTLHEPPPASSIRRAWHRWLRPAERTYLPQLPQILVPASMGRAAVSRLVQWRRVHHPKPVAEAGEMILLSPIRLVRRNQPPRGSGLQPLRFLPGSQGIGGSYYVSVACCLRPPSTAASAAFPAIGPHAQPRLPRAASGRRLSSVVSAGRQLELWLRRTQGFALLPSLGTGTVCWETRDEFWSCMLERRRFEHMRTKLRAGDTFLGLYELATATAAASHNSGTNNSYCGRKSVALATAFEGSPEEAANLVEAARRAEALGLPLDDFNYDEWLPKSPRGLVRGPEDLLRGFLRTKETAAESGSAGRSDLGNTLAVDQWRRVSGASRAQALPAGEIPWSTDA